MSFVPSSPPSSVLRRSVACLSLLAAAASLHGAVSLSAVFGSHMVLQRDQPIPVWGRATPGEAVTITLDADHVRVVAGQDGRWRTDLPARSSGGPLVLTVEGQNRLRFEDVLIGDVWLVSGQSNMALRVEQARDAKSEIAAANFPSIRLLNVGRAIAAEDQFTFKGAWAPCSPSTVAEFSAVGYFMGRQLHQNLGVPVGLIHSSCGGTAA